MGREIESPRLRRVQALDFIVPHVNDKEVWFVRGALAGDRQDNVGVDSAHGGVHHFKTALRKLLFEHHFQYSPESKRGIGRPFRRRLTQNKYPKGSSGFAGGHENWVRLGGNLAVVELPAELAV